MNEEGKTSDNKRETTETALPVHITDPLNSPVEQPATEQHLNQVENKLTIYERSTLRWTKATFWILGITCLFIGFQGYEMYSGSADTKTLASQTKNLADRMKDQADQTKIIAEQAKISADSSQKQVDLLRSQLVGSQGSVLSLRFDLRKEGVVLNLGPAMGSTPFPGSRVRAKSVDIAITIATESLPDRKLIYPPVSFRRRYRTLGANFSNETIPLPDLDSQSFDAFQSRLERLVAIKGKFSYDDGFGDINSEDVCLIYFGIQTKYLKPGYSNSGFRACGDFNDKLLSEALRMKHEDDEARANPATPSANKKAN